MFMNFRNKSLYVCVCARVQLESYSFKATYLDNLNQALFMLFCSPNEIVPSGSTSTSVAINHTRLITHSSFNRLRTLHSPWKYNQRCCSAIIRFSYIISNTFTVTTYFARYIPDFCRVGDILATICVRDQMV